MKSSQQSSEEAKQLRLFKRKTDMAGIHSSTVNRMLKGGRSFGPAAIRHALNIEARNIGMEVAPDNTFDQNGDVFVSTIRVRCLQTGEGFRLEYREWK